MVFSWDQIRIMVVSQCNQKSFLKRNDLDFIDHGGITFEYLRIFCKI